MTEFAFSATILLIIIIGYWSLVVFPKQRAYKKHVRYVETMQVGDEVITYGGLIGTITKLDEEIGVASIQIAEGIEVRILAAALQQPYDPEEIARSVQLAKGQ